MSRGNPEMHPGGWLGPRAGDCCGGEGWGRVRGPEGGAGAGAGG